MTVACYPLDAVTGAPSYTGRMLRETISALVGGASTARPLGALSGVRPGTPSTTVALSGFNWTCEPHSGILDVQAAAEAGPYFYAVTADETGTVNAAHASLVRTDLIVVTLSDPAESDGSSVPEADIVYAPGTAGGGTPATPARSMVLARINVPQSGGGSPTVTWVAPTLFAAGARPSRPTYADLATLNAYSGMEATVETAPGAFYKYDGSVWEMHGVPVFTNTTARDAALTAPVNGDKCLVESNGFTYKRISGAWQPWESPWTSFTSTVVGAPISARDEKYQYVAGDIIVDGELTVSAVQTSGVTVTTPVAVAQPTSSQSVGLGVCEFVDVGSTSYPGVVDQVVADIVRLLWWNASGTALAKANVSPPSTPFGMVSGDRIKYRYTILKNR